MAAVINETRREVFQLQGLGCSDCALKMEQELLLLKGVQKASVHFATEKLVIELDRQACMNDDFFDQTEKIVKSIEPDVSLIPANEAIVGGKSTSEPDGFQWIYKYAPHVFAVILLLLGWVLPVGEGVRWGIHIGAYWLVGGKVIRKAIENMAGGRIFDEHFLMTIATLGAFAIGELPEAVAVMLFYRIGEAFQDHAVDHSRRSIAELMNIRPEFARRMTGGDFQEVHPSMVSMEERVLVRPGERIPLDGVVESGTGSVDVSMMTGESMPLAVEPGSEVLSGTINQSTPLVVRVTKTYESSAVAKILELVEESAEKKSKSEQFITSFARIYTPVVVVLAMLVAFVPPFIMADASFSTWIYRGLIFLVISCPCALVISIPLGFYGGIGGASRNGILVKGGQYLEALNQVDTLVFDKTGTLTKGVFNVKEVIPADSVDPGTVMRIAALAENQSNHPIARGLRKAWNGTDDASVKVLEEIPGRGVHSLVNGKDVLVGNPSFLEERGVTPRQITSEEAVVYVAENGSFVGALVMGDQIREGMAELVTALKEWGIHRIIMVTGDRKPQAESVARKTGIDEVYAEMLPQDKVRMTERFMESRKGRGKVMVVGDGVNDAPVLALADVGVSMGGLGSDAAIEAADVVVMKDDPRQLLQAFFIARRTKTIVWQNIYLSLGIKALVMILGIIGMATIWAAIFADVGVALLAVLNATRVLYASSEAKNALEHV